jgi:hypothetical protein
LEERLQQVRAAYTDKPGLGLTPSQAQRLFGLEPVEWVTVIEALLAEHFLRRTREGLFVRSGITHEPRSDHAQRSSDKNSLE